MTHHDAPAPQRRPGPTLSDEGPSPEPTLTASGPAYEGRLLDRPDEEVVDQGAAFDIRTLLTRRGVLSLMGIGAGTAVLAACAGDSGSGSTSSSAGTASGSSTAATGEIPEETNGPYPADGTQDLNILEESGIERSDIRSSLDGGSTVEGVPLTFTFTITDLTKDSAPFAGAALYVWHCNAKGEYSMYTQGVENETWLRGIQVADDKGQVTFETVVPGCYQGRWTHFHIEAYPDLASATNVSNAIATSQVSFPADMLGEVYKESVYAGSTENLAGVGSSPTDDMIFGDGDASLQLGTFTGDVKSGYTGSINVAIDTTTEPGAAGGMGAPPPR